MQAQLDRECQNPQAASATDAFESLPRREQEMWLDNPATRPLFVAEFVNR